MTVVYIQRVFAHYRLACYDKLRQQFDFRLLHSRTKTSIEQSNTSYSSTIPAFKIGKSETSIYLFSLLALLRMRPDVIIHEFAIGILSLPMVWVYTKLFNKKLLLYSHGYNRKEGFNPVDSLKDKYRLWLIRQADALLVYCKEDKILLSEFVPAKKIFVAQNTVDTNALLPLRDQFRIQTKGKLRNQLGWSQNHAHLIFVGRLYKSKLVDQLLYTVSELLKRSNSVILHIVGDGPELLELKRLCSELELNRHVYFHGAVLEQNIVGKMLFSSDLMVMPGAVGLSVNHAFCFECPVLTTKISNTFPEHGPEINYIIHKETGIIVESLSANILANAIENYLDDSSLRSTMVQNISSKIENELSIGHMVGGIDNALRYVSGL